MGQNSKPQSVLPPRHLRRAWQSLLGLDHEQGWSSLTLTGNWEKHTIDGNANGVLTDEVDRYEFTTPSVFEYVDEWKNGLSNKTGTNKDDATYRYDVNGNLTAEVVDIVRVTTNTERRDFAYDGRHARRTPRLLVRLEPVGLGTRGKSAARSRHVGAR